MQPYQYYFAMMKKIVVPFAASIFIFVFFGQASSRDFKPKGGNHNPILQFVFCSDVHFGLVKPVFRNRQNVTSSDVNAAMVAQMNLLPSMMLPNDKGVASGKSITGIEAVVITGDICNRQEKGVQSASASWGEFIYDYVSKLQLTDNLGNKSKLLLTSGNHDISDAIGYEKPMYPLIDKTAMVSMYNMMMQPAVAKTSGNFNHTTDKINYSRNIGGIHFMFVDGWPDSAERVWMEKDLQKVTAEQPVLLFAHAMPDVEARFFTNPNGDHSINRADKFENLVDETFKDGNTVEDSPILEHRGLANFLQAHPNIRAYFHGHSNYTEFYDWKGPDDNIDVPCFRVDSPMKGKYSAKDETKLSFELVTIDTSIKKMTVRECLWDTHPSDGLQKIEWGTSRTISLD